jgi:hypothetical protein
MSWVSGLKRSGIFVKRPRIMESEAYTSQNLSKSSVDRLSDVLRRNALHFFLDDTEGSTAADLLLP